ncbi:MAG: shikimate dehydrogenase [Gemmataceae bacterium]
MSQTKRSQICVVIGRTRHKMMVIEIEEATKRGAELIELRLDFLARAPDFKRLLAIKSPEDDSVTRPKLVATVRRITDGGRWSGNEEARGMLLRQSIVNGFDAVDIETDIADSIPRYGDVQRIISYHNLRGMPDDLEKLHERMCNQDGDIVKIAVTATDPEDNLRVLELLKKPKKPTVAFCMGDLGFPSRVLGAQYGVPFTYAAFNKERGIAPGLPSFLEMRELYRFEQVTSETQIFGVIGDPIAHSMSPYIHNKTLKKLDLPGVYLPFRVPRGKLQEFLKAYRKLPTTGFSVTIPHKEAALSLATEPEDAAQQIGAANTLIRTEKGWAAYNTDAKAALDSLMAHMAVKQQTGNPTLESLTVLLLGAGGVARALGHMLGRNGALVTIANRTTERAQQLSESVGCRYVDWSARHTVLADLVVNCTSVGMHPAVDESPLHPSYLKPGLVVFDTVYTPENTLLVKDARDRECHVLTGVDMFVRQAALQFKLFTGNDAPLELMDKYVRRALSPVMIRDED